MGKRIVFISIFDLTRVFYEIATALSAAGHAVFWITTDEYWTGWLVARGVSRDAILQLVFSPRDFLDPDEKKRRLAEIIHSEAGADLTLNQTLMMDQFIMYKNKPDINEYLFLYYDHIKRFLEENRITDLIAEPTNTNEMVAYMICRELGINYISPCDLRHPPGRLVFFDSYLQKTVIPRRDTGENVSGQALIDVFTSNGTPPPYFEKLAKMRVLDPVRLTKSVLNRVKRNAVFQRNNLTHHDLAGRIGLAVSRVINGFYLRHLCRYDDLDQISGRIAYYPLHVQPESSIDVLGSYFSDQLNLIKNIRRSLPFDVTLVVKEHPNFLGIKKISFFRALRRIPNVKLVRHDVSSFDIYKRSAIIFTVSGTPAMEAGMMGIPAVVFCDMYYNGLSSIHLCTDLTKMRELVDRLLGSFSRDYESDCRFIEQLVKDSYDAFWSNPILYPSVIGPENLAKLRSAFLNVVADDCP